MNLELRDSRSYEKKPDTFMRKTTLFSGNQNFLLCRMDSIESGLINLCHGCRQVNNGHTVKGRFESIE
ncbi:hypothetical protein KFK09_008232 [Dendrobium nobile]|uniref:Uncharacterized protein n=1 Tax=Dendrobium nobile TaxID=94219 RepID=A0A8T3BKL0_DENNO|nr:hypothetical protein KFK09_008232 [Dendrobium nobile]